MSDPSEIADLKRRLAGLERHRSATQRSGCGQAFVWVFGVLVALVVLIALLATCSTTTPTVNDPPSDTRLIIDAEYAIKDKLRDPASARFDGERVSRKSGNPVVCGYVNAKNGFGGMSGRTRFMVGGALAMTEDEDREAFPLAWSRLC